VRGAPRISGRAKGAYYPTPSIGEFVKVRFAREQRTGVSQAAHDVSISSRAIVSKKTARCARHLTGYVNQVLDPDCGPM
jgi:hypothetical protein